MTTALSIIAISISALTFAWTIAWSVYTHRRANRLGAKVTGRRTVQHSQSRDWSASQPLTK